MGVANQLLPLERHADVGLEVETRAAREEIGIVVLEPHQFRVDAGGEVLPERLFPSREQAGQPAKGGSDR